MAQKKEVEVQRRRNIADRKLLEAKKRMEILERETAGKIKQSKHDFKRRMSAFNSKKDEQRMLEQREVEDLQHSIATNAKLKEFKQLEKEKDRLIQLRKKQLNKEVMKQLFDE